MLMSARRARKLYFVESPQLYFVGFSSNHRCCLAQRQYASLQFFWCSICGISPFIRFCLLHTMALVFRHLVGPELCTVQHA